jgi:hypothetical protein
MLERAGSDGLLCVFSSYDIYRVSAPISGLKNFVDIHVTSTSTNSKKSENFEITKEELFNSIEESYDIEYVDDSI